MNITNISPALLELLKNLPDNTIFTRTEINTIGKNLNFSLRSIDTYVYTAKYFNLITKISFKVYKKT